MTNRLRPVAVAVLAVGALAACRKKPEPAPAPVATNGSAVNRDSIDAAERARREAAERARLEEERRRAAAAVEAARAALIAPIYFDFDQSEIRDDARATLEAKLPVLQANPQLRIRIEGHTDERGSDEYNLALGQRRAAAAKRWLVARGIAEGRIDVISYGEERPVDRSGDEAGFARNRRDEFVIVAGAEGLRAP